MMKISIVVPVYNAEKYLQECIQSVLNQTNSNWELVLVDDGSTDKSGEICDCFANKYPDKILSFHKANEGQFLTRQYGTKKCSGEYIGFLDADDTLNCKYVSEITNVLATQGNPQIICFAYKYGSRVYELPEDKSYVSFEERQTVYSHVINGQLTGSLCSKVISKKLLCDTVLDENIVIQKRYGEDAFQSVGLFAKAESVVYLNKVLYSYRVNPDGASQGFDSRSLEHFNTKYVFSLIEDNLLLWGMNTEEIKKQLYARNFNETVYCILKFYRSAENSERKKQVVEYDWTSYLLDETPKYIENNENVRKSYIKVWKAFCDKNYAEIYVRERFKRFIGW